MGLSHELLKMSFSSARGAPTSRHVYYVVSMVRVTTTPELAEGRLNLAYAK
jgi:hypothetical protein